MKDDNVYIEVLKSKIHRVKITGADLNYVGSIELDEDLIEGSGLMENEKVQVLNINNGERFETYVIKAGRGTGTVCLNGPAARKGEVGDILIVVSYALMTQEKARQYKPQIVFPDSENKVAKA